MYVCPFMMCVASIETHTIKHFLKVTLATDHKGSWDPTRCKMAATSFQMVSTSSSLYPRVFID